MDIQFLGSGPSTKAVIYYITDYITKAQLKTHVAYAALAIAIQKLEKINVTDDVPTVRAKKLLQKCAYSMIACQELSGQQVASYLQDLEDHFTSHTFQPIYWTNFEHIVDHVFPLTHVITNSDSSDHDSDNENSDASNNNNDVEEHSDLLLDLDNLDDAPQNNEPNEDEIMISADINGELEIRTPYVQDYVLRGKILKSLCLWEYTSLIQKLSKKHVRYDDHKINDHAIDSITSEDNSHSRPKYLFDHDHPNYDTHIQQLRHPNHRPLPTPIGPSLSRRDRPEMQEKYCRLMLIFFKPWNRPQDLIYGHESFDTAFDTFLHENEKWNSLLNNMQLLHECHRDDHFESQSRIRNKDISSIAEKFHGDNVNFETINSQEIAEALLNHLTAIDNS